MDGGKQLQAVLAEQQRILQYIQAAKLDPVRFPDIEGARRGLEDWVAEEVLIRKEIREMELPAGYDDWKTMTPEENQYGRHRAANPQTCPACYTEFPGWDREVRVCKDCHVEGCQLCIDHACDWCDTALCANCVNDVGASHLCRGCAKEYAADLEEQ